MVVHTDRSERQTVGVVATGRSVSNRRRRSSSKRRRRREEGRKEGSKGGREEGWKKEEYKNKMKTMKEVITTSLGILI